MAFPENSFLPLAMNTAFRALLFCIAFAYATCTAWAQNDPASRRKTIETLLEEGSYGEALQQATLWKTTAMGAEVSMVASLLRIEALLGLNEALVARDELTQLSAPTTLAGSGIPPQVWKLILGARVHLQLGSFSAAFDPLAEAEMLVIESGEPDLLAEVGTWLGIAHWSVGNYEQALEYHQAAVIDREKSQGSTAGPLINLGLVFASQEEWGQAIYHYDQGIRILSVEGKQNTQAYISALTNLGIAYLSRPRGDLREAEKAFNAAKAALLTRYDNLHPNVQFINAYLGQVAHKRGQFDVALDIYFSVRDAYTKRYQAHHPDIANTWNLIGQTLSEAGQYDDAVDAHSAALASNLENYQHSKAWKLPELADEGMQPELAITTLQFLGRALEARYYGKTLKKPDLEAALACLQQADLRLQKLRQRRTREADRLTLSKLSATLYDDGVRLCEGLAEISLRSKPYHELAFSFAEAGKSAVLSQAIAETNAQSFAGVPQEIIDSEREVTRDIAHYEQRLAEQPLASEAQAWFSKLVKLRQQHDRMIQQVETDFPAYYQLKYAEKKTTVADIQPLLPQGTALVSYYYRPSDQRLSIFWVTTDDFGTVHTATQEDFVDRVAAMRNFMTYRVEEGYQKTIYPLYNQLFPKRLRLPKGISELILIPHRELSLIPWEALSTNTNKSGNPSYLIEDYSLKYCYSAGLFAQLQARPRDETTNSIYMMAPVQFAPFRLPSLPGTLTEIDNIAEVASAQGWTVTAHTENEATEDVFRQEDLNTYRVVHMATHGEINPDQPALSRLLLKEATTDGVLYSGDIFGLNLNADLVALSACETGLGKLQRGEGLIGLTRAFLFAGSQRLLVSLWTVSDESTALLTTQLYQNALQNKLSWSQALRASKLNMLRGSNFSAPYYWAPFILVGE